MVSSADWCHVVIWGVACHSGYVKVCIGLSRFVWSIQTDSQYPGLQLKVFHTSFLILVTWKAWNWIRDLLPAKQMLFHRAMEPHNKCRCYHFVYLFVCLFSDQERNADAIRDLGFWRAPRKAYDSAYLAKWSMRSTIEVALGLAGRKWIAHLSGL